MFDPFVLETPQGVAAWTAEDGGRIRHRDPATGVWSFQSVPAEVKDTLHRVHFLESGPLAGLRGWAVGQNGWVLRTDDGGGTWSTVARVDDATPGDDAWEELYDVHFLDAQQGWLVGLHSFWFSVDGGSSWSPVTVLDDQVPPQFLDLTQSFVELYALDIVVRGDGTRVGLASAQPGWVLRNTSQDLLTWQLVWRATSLCPPDPANCGLPGSVLQGCECALCEPSHQGPWFEAWDVELRRHPTEKLALLGGGVGSQCGLIFASTDDGTTWTKEWHECTCTGPGCKTDCASDPLYNDDPTNPNDLTRHKSYRTIYGLGIFDGDATAVAAAYNGQHLVRDAANGVWVDRSVFSPEVPTTMGSVIFPLIGADAGPGTGATSLAVVSGEGGHLRESANGGHAWNDAQGVNGPILGEPHRVQDVFFRDDDVGWQVGQFFRIARTDNGGKTWLAQAPNATPNTGSFQAITFESNLFQKGVAVGDPYIASQSGETTSQPKIRYTLTGGAPDWKEDVTILGNPYWLDDKALREVDWSGGSSFWAAGEAGLILSSTDDGKTWRTFLPQGETDFNLFEIEGVSFLDTSTGLFIGRRPNPSPNGPLQGAAYQYRDFGGTVTWTAIALPAGPTIDGLWDVDVASGTAWAVGVRTVGGLAQGVVLSSAWNPGLGAFDPFVEVVNPTGFPRCTAGQDLAGVPVLNEVEVAPTGEVWVGGACGRVWVRATTGTWTEVKSQTDAHVVGMSFVPAPGGAAGYLAGFRASQTQQCIVRVQ